MSQPASFKHDFRSDTVTKPGKGMRDAMANAEVGDDVFGDDPTVLRLEAVMAERLGKEAAVFVTSGTQSNLVALMSHCARGEEYLVGQMAHCYRWEGGGAAVLGSIQPQPIMNQPDGRMALEDIQASIKPDDPHFAITRLLALENTIGGKVLPMSYMTEATDLARQHGLSTHLDGARGFNAVTAMGIDIAELAKPFDSVSICLSKGLGAPIGSVLVGSKELISRARRMRKMLGGGLRQVGVIAAAGLYALENNVERLAEDHAHARMLAEGLNAVEGLTADMPDTNIIFVKVDPQISDSLAQHLKSHGIGYTELYGQQRWVTHLDVGEAAIHAALQALASFSG